MAGDTRKISQRLDFANTLVWFSFDAAWTLGYTHAAFVLALFTILSCLTSITLSANRPERIINAAAMFWVGMDLFWLLEDISDFAHAQVAAMTVMTLCFVMLCAAWHSMRGKLSGADDKLGYSITLLWFAMDASWMQANFHLAAAGGLLAFCAALWSIKRSSNRAEALVNASMALWIAMNLSCMFDEVIYNGDNSLLTVTLIASMLLLLGVSIAAPGKAVQAMAAFRKVRLSVHPVDFNALSILPPSVISIDAEPKPEWTELRLEGRLDVVTAKDFLENVERLVKEGCRDIRLNASALEYLSSSGLRALLQSHRLLEAASGRFRVCSSSAPVLRVIYMAGMQELLSFTPAEGQGAEL